MQTREVLECLKELADKLDIEILHEKLGIEDFGARGGLCKVRGKYKIFLDRSQTIEDQVNVLAKALSGFNTEDVYILPHVRGLLEKAQKTP